MASRVASLLLLSLICFSFSAADVPSDCCLDKVDKKVPHQLVVSYTLQEEGNGCRISAAVLFTRKGRKLCVFHPSESLLTQFLIEKMENKKKQ